MACHISIGYYIQYRNKFNYISVVQLFHPKIQLGIIYICAKQHNFLISSHNNSVLWTQWYR